MKRFLKWTFIAVVFLGGTFFIFKEPVVTFFFDVLTEDMFRTGDDDSFTASLNEGDSIPKIKALYNGKVIDSLEQFAGENGYVLMINRSVDWCPFCKRQATNVNDYVDTFKKNGVGVVMITYDKPELQQKFIDKFSIKFPIISDVDATSMKALDVLNPKYPEGNDNYGIANPGTLVVSKEGKIVGKLFLERYENRVDAQNILTFTLDKLELFDQATF